MWHQLSRYFLRRFRRYVIYRGNDTEYLRSLGMKIGEGTRVSLRTTHVGTEPWLVTIGANVTLAYGVVLLTHDGASRLFRRNYPQLNQRFGNAFGRIIIEDNCFIGAGAIVLPGVTVGPDTIIGAGSVVTHDISPRSVAAGNPARVIKTLDEYVNNHLQKAVIPLTATNFYELRSELSEILK
jgi:acetyltransferase-like isoleucine patch superfamily enzyme